MFWPPTRGDRYDVAERWTLNGVTASNSDRGRLYMAVHATTLVLYSDLECTASVAQVTGGHGSPSTRTRKALAALNTSGITGSVYYKHDSDAVGMVIEVYPVLGTDTEIETLCPNMVSRWPKSDAATTFERQHVKAREDLIAKLMKQFPPLPNTVSPINGSAAAIWVVNDHGDYECKRLQNPWAYRNWCLWRVIELATQQQNVILEESDQFRLVEDAREQQERAWEEAGPLVDSDADLDADTDLPRFRLYRS